MEAEDGRFDSSGYHVCSGGNGGNGNLYTGVVSVSPGKQYEIVVGKGGNGGVNVTSLYETPTGR